MRFTWFNLMPWPYLPDDFRETNRSVWVDIDSKLYDPVRGHTVYNDYLDLSEYADALGYDGVGINEHHQNGYGLMPSPNLIAASLTRRTAKAAIVVLGNSIALHNPPLRVAEGGDRPPRQLRPGGGFGENDGPMLLLAGFGCITAACAQFFPDRREEPDPASWEQAECPSGMAVPAE